MKSGIKIAFWILMAMDARAQSFDELVKLYNYDRAAPLNLQQTEMDSRAGYRLSSVRYDLPKTGHVPGYLVAPDGGGRKPAIVWMHSGGAIQFLGDAVLMAKLGAVSILIGQAEDTPSGTPEQARDQLILDVVSLRRAADILGARSDVDPARLALVGHSYGAMMGAVAIAVDNRFHAAVFECGLLGMSIHIATSPGSWAAGVRKQLGSGLPHFLEVISVADAKNYIGQAPTIPKLFQSAWYDPGVPHKDAENFYLAATGPKELKWYDTGHDVDDIAALADRARFLAENLHLMKVDKVLREEIGVR
ncbi:MAG TPA: prolyl oligopeptidase family serine peptidase [Bryobacteraceae bacterium]|nr:prolyl oligopeptidase family serine peptidase [Bryobacteraceae bacterium]